MMPARSAASTTCSAPARVIEQVQLCQAGIRANADCCDGCVIIGFQLFNFVRCIVAAIAETVGQKDDRVRVTRIYGAVHAPSIENFIKASFVVCAATCIQVIDGCFEFCLLIQRERTQRVAT